MKIDNISCNLILAWANLQGVAHASGTECRSKCIGALIMVDEERQALYRRFGKAYLSLFAIIGVFVVVSMVQGAGWRPALAGMPLYVTVFGGITYQLIKEIRALKRKGARDSE